MNSALKPVLPQPGVPQPGGQSSPAKGNVASANHAGALPQGAQNHSLPVAPNHSLPSAPNHSLPSAPNHSLPSAPNHLLPSAPNHSVPSAPNHPLQAGPTNSLHGAQSGHPPHAPSPHAAACMAPVSANMAQMAQNMSHHGNLSHMPLAPPAASPSKAASTSAPLSLVQDKVMPPSQPLALTRTPDKKEPDSTAQANGAVDSPKSATNAPVTFKPQNPEPNKDKQDIAKTSPSTPKPPEKPSCAPSTPQKPEPANPVSQTDKQAIQPKVVTANEPLAGSKSPSKPIELKPAPTADVAPTQSDSKPVPESANDTQLQEKVSPPKQEAPADSSKERAKVEDKQEEPKLDKVQPTVDKEVVKEKVDTPKIDAPKVDTPKVDTPKVEPAKMEPTPEKLQKTEVVQEKVEEKKPAKAEVKPKSTLKLATVTPPMRKRRQASPSKLNDGPSTAKKATEGDSTPDSRTKRNRTKVQLYQSPTPELTMATKLSASAGRATPTKPNDDKLIVFYKNEYLAVRNAEGGFYVCQAMQNVYRTTRKIKIRWLSQDKAADPSGETYKPDFYDVTDMECVLTTLSLQRAAGGGGAQALRPLEHARASSILLRALKAERPTHLTPEHPDGLDLSLYTDESQLEKKSRKRNSSKSSPRAKLDNDDDTSVETATPVKKARTTPKRSPKSARKTKLTPTKIQSNNKRKSPGSTPIVASTSKTATAVTEKAKAKSTPVKRTPIKHKDTPIPARKTTRASRESKQSPIVPTPSTSTGKITRTPRKPPAKK